MNSSFYFLVFMPMIFIFGPVVQNAQSKYLLVDFEADEDEKAYEGKYSFLNSNFFLLPF